MSVFYTTDISHGYARLSPEESAHCLRVLRMKRGDRVEVIDGMGGYYDAVIDTADPKGCVLEITQVRAPRSQKDRIHIAIAPTKLMDRFEWFVEKAVEIGIDEITPIRCQRSERRVLKTERLDKLIISTLKQAKVAHKPVLHGLTPFNEILSVTNEGSDRFIAHCESNRTGLLKDLCVQGHQTLVLIGPEGDFTPEEIEQATNSGFIPVSLGDNRLRTETAGIVACHILHVCG